MEGFFGARGIGYAFGTRAESATFQPPIEWQSEDAVGYYATVIRGVGIEWRLLASRNLRIRVEIDSDDMVVGLFFEGSYTGF